MNKEIPIVCINLQRAKERRAMIVMSVTDVVLHFIKSLRIFVRSTLMAMIIIKKAFILS
jgi:hypothetical protein